MSTGRREPRGVTRERVRTLLDEGWAPSQIARTLGIAKSVVSYHARALGLPPDMRYARRFDWAEVQRYYDAGNDFKACQARFGFCGATWTQAIARGDIVPRDRAAPIGVYLVAGRRTNRQHLKLRLLREGLKVAACDECGISEWRGAPLSLELHHVNGVGDDNRLIISGGRCRRRGGNGREHRRQVIDHAQRAIASSP